MRKHIARIACVVFAFLTLDASAQEQTNYAYDALGRLVQVSTNSGTTTAYNYDKASNRSRVQTVTPATIGNGSFEHPNLANYQYLPAAPDLQFVGSAGISVEGDAWGFPSPWEGRQVAFLQSSSSSIGAVQLQARNLTVGRTYRIMFALSQRPDYGVNTVRLLINGTLAWSSAPASDQQFTAYLGPTFTAAATTADLRFESSLTPNDSGSGLDAIGIQRLD